ncbi:MAG: glutamate synthase large subunit [Planctomycetota bacterium]
MKHPTSTPPASSSTRPAATGLPSAQGLYDPANEKDSCGIGFIAHLKGEPSHAIVADALEMLHRMDHRGACGCEKNTGDGAGILTALPHDLLVKCARRDAHLELPAAGDYAAGNIFLPTDSKSRGFCIDLYEQMLDQAGIPLIGWRDLPVDPDGADIGPSARASMPVFKQLFVARPDRLDADAFERALYLVRNRVINLALARTGPDDLITRAGSFYICSLSARTIIYKGQLTSGQVPLLYPDLRDPDYVSHLAMVHSRFSTNTFPSWDRAQPCRMMSHNGEINTVRGNKNWVRARQGLMESEPFGRGLNDLFPIVNPEASDSGSMDNVLEMLYMSGRSLPEAVMMMVPEAWENHESMPPQKRAFYEYPSNLQEPWDGPASIGFTDGTVIGATLDRNGLRPSRYYVTDDHRVIMASEVGVVDVPPQNIVKKGRLQPGRMFLVNFEEGRIVADEEVKDAIATARPYGPWLEEHRLELPDLPPADPPDAPDPETRLALLQSFGYTVEHLNMLLLPMVNAGTKSKEALGSMGNDAALAVLSDKPRLLYDYFKQLFAQVTNPPIDPLRETIIMSLRTNIGPEGNLLETTPGQCRRLHLPRPVLTDRELASIKALDGSSASQGWRTFTIDITYPLADYRSPLSGKQLEQGKHRPAEIDGAALTAALDRICAQATDAIAAGYQLVVLSDRNAGPGRIALPSLLAVGTVHHHLVRSESRTKIGLVLESGEAREVHHFCTLAGYGCDAVNPYLAYQALFSLRDTAVLDPELADDAIVQTYLKSVAAGIQKVMSKMGISTLASYKGAQIFECVGLRDQVIERSFAGTASRLQGVGWDVLAQEGQRRHELGFPTRAQRRLKQLPNPGEYHWRPEGEAHAYSPQSIANLQQAARGNNQVAYDAYARLCNDDARQRCTLRGLLGFSTPSSGPIPLQEVEPAKEIVKRFRTGAMSLGALSKEAHETLALAMNRVGGYSNSGEGGEDPNRFSLDQYGDGSPKSKRSAIKQIASGRFGVTSYYLANADMLQIKIAQGAKPGEGGQLPGFKVDPYIASIRHSTPGVGLISPPPHHDIYSIEDLSQLIYDLKRSNPAADVSVKLVAEVGVGTVAAGVSKAKADHILISGHDGGTGASPLTSIKHAGLPWELGLAETHQTLVLNDLRSRVRLETDGGFKTGRDVVIAACLGAEEFGFSTAPLITIGCIMMRKCHLNTCPVGVCTQDKDLRKKFSGTPEHVINFLFLVAEEARRYMAQIGIKNLDDLVGRVDLLQTRDAIQHWKTDGIDLTPILQPAAKPYPDAGIRKLIEQEHDVHLHLDNTLIKEAGPALEHRQPVTLDHPITNLDRAVGVMLSHEVSKRHGQPGLPADTITLNFAGSAGQSLGAWLASGVTIHLTGDANDYVGKGLSGGKIILRPPAESPFPAQNNVILGNVALYGATAGEAYFRGVAAERFCVRNSGAHAVVEGVGDHACEYMTGGRAVILGPTGRNFAAGMSGGIAYVYDPDDVFSLHCNLGMVELEKTDDPDDIAELLVLVRNHHTYTGSAVAEKLLGDWEQALTHFIKVMPIDYRRVLLQQKASALQNAEPEVGHG